MGGIIGKQRERREREMGRERERERERAIVDASTISFPPNFHTHTHTHTHTSPHTHIPSLTQHPPPAHTHTAVLDFYSKSLQQSRWDSNPCSQSKMTTTPSVVCVWAEKSTNNSYIIYKLDGIYPRSE